MWKRNSSNKFNNRKSRGIDGRMYHSSFEAVVSNLLLADERAGKIRILKRQQHIHLVSNGIKLCEYWPDFTILDLEKNEIYWTEAKGKENLDWLIKLNLWRAGGPGRLEIYRGSWKAPKKNEIVIPANPGLHIRQEQVFGSLQ